MVRAHPSSNNSQATNALLLLTVFNHASWSTLHIASRYLQVYAEPVTFDGQGLLSSAKGSAAFFLFLVGIINSWIENSNDSSPERNGCVNNEGASGSTVPPSSGPSANATLSASASCLNDSNHNYYSCEAPTKDRDEGAEETRITDEATILQRKKVFYTLLFAFVSTTRASSNIASSKYTYPYNITLIASLTPIIIAIFDRIILRSPFPPLIWPTILLSSLGGFLIAISQSLDSDNSDGHDKISPKDNLIGCSLQLLSAIFSAFARILMKNTETILTPTHIVQTNNISNCLFPFIYTTMYHPSSWRAFRYLIFHPKSLLAWCTMSIGVYTFASTLQIRLVRKLGPGFYSSWVAVRVLGSMILSALVLGEGIAGWLEWVGIGLMIVTISVYLVETRRWMDRRKEQKGYEEVRAVDDEGTGGGEEELVLVPSREGNALLEEKMCYDPFKSTANAGARNHRINEKHWDSF